MKDVNYKILFVCLGNICRSPTAHGIFQKKIDNLSSINIEIDSCGTGDWHIGAPPDARMQAKALEFGYDLSELRARQVKKQDFYDFNLILAMDKKNLHNLNKLMPNDTIAELDLFLRYSGHSIKHDIEEVPDPYFGGEQGFTDVVNLVEDACDKLIEKLLVTLNADQST